MLTDPGIGAAYAELLEDAATRDLILGRIRAEHALSLAALRDLTGRAEPGARLPDMRQRFDGLRPDLDRINRLQVALLRRTRTEAKARTSIPLMQSMNCIAAGLGWTG